MNCQKKLILYNNGATSNTVSTQKEHKFTKRQPKNVLQLAKSTSTLIQNLVFHHDIFTNAMALQMPHPGTKAGCFICPHYYIHIKLLHEHQNHSKFKFVLFSAIPVACRSNYTFTVL